MNRIRAESMNETGKLADLIADCENHPEAPMQLMAAEGGYVAIWFGRHAVESVYAQSGVIIGLSAEQKQGLRELLRREAGEQ